MIAVILLAFALALSLTQRGLTAEFNKCVDNEGKVIISNTGCPADTKPVSSFKGSSAPSYGTLDPKTQELLKKVDDWMKRADQHEKKCKGNVTPECRKEAVELLNEAGGVEELQRTDLMRRLQRGW